jgi:hypothetical protein
MYGGEIAGVANVYQSQCERYDGLIPSIPRSCPRCTIETDDDVQDERRLIAGRSTPGYADKAIGK